MPKRYKIFNEKWDKIKRSFSKKSKTGKPSKWSNRIMFSAILWLAHSGATWEYIPNYYPPHQSVYIRFCKWRYFGVFKRIFHMIGANADLENLCIDSTCVKAHPQSSGAKRGCKFEIQSIYWNKRRRKSTKIHAIVDALGISCIIYAFRETNAQQQNGYKFA